MVDRAELPSAPGTRAVQRTTEQPPVDRREALRRAFQPRVVPVTVQAVREEPAASGGTGAAAESAPGESVAQGEQEPDIDALARDVYHILRRRLQVERERDLGRF
jgi:hypothetical protein